jgi:hypothetical protein
VAGEEIESVEHEEVGRGGEARLRWKKKKKERKKAALSGDRGEAIDRASEKVGERGKDYSARIISSTSPSFPHFFKRPTPLRPARVRDIFVAERSFRAGLVVF